MSGWTSFRDSTLQVVAGVAPTLATALGGPLAGQAVSVLSSALLGHPNGSPADVEAALAKVAPEQLAAIRKADQDYAAKLKELDIDLEKVNAADRDSARRREVDSHDVWTPRILAALVVVGAFVAEGYALTHVIPAGLELISGRVLGTIDSALLCVLYYYFGSNSSSRAKDATIAKAVGA